MDWSNSLNFMSNSFYPFSKVSVSTSWCLHCSSGQDWDSDWASWRMELWGQCWHQPSLSLVKRLSNTGLLLVHWLKVMLQYKSNAADQSVCWLYPRTNAQCNVPSCSCKELFFDWKKPKEKQSWTVSLSVSGTWEGTCLRVEKGQMFESILTWILTVSRIHRHPSQNTIEI